MEFLVGVLSGIVASVLSYVGRHILGRIASLLTRDRARNVSGRWRTTFRENGSEHHETAELW